MPDDIRRKIERLSPVKPSKQRDSRTDIVGQIPNFKVPRPAVRQETLTDAAVPPPGQGNVRRGPPPLPRQAPQQLLSEPPSDAEASHFNVSEIPTRPDPPERISREDLQAYIAYELRRNAPIEKTQAPPPPRSVSPPSGTKKHEFGIDAPTRSWIQLVLGLLVGGGIATGTVAVKDATDAPKADVATFSLKEKQALLDEVKAITLRAEQSERAWRNQDREMAQWLSAVLPPLGVKVVFPNDAEPTEPLELLPTPGPEHFRVKGKGGKPVQPPPIPIPSK